MVLILEVTYFANITCVVPAPTQLATCGKRVTDTTGAFCIGRATDLSYIAEDGHLLTSGISSDTSGRNGGRRSERAELHDGTANTRKLS